MGGTLGCGSGVGDSSGSSEERRPKMSSALRTMARVSLSLEFAFGIFEFLECCPGGVADVAVFLELKGFTTGGGEGVEKTSEGGGVAAEFAFEAAGAQVAQGVVDVERAELESALVYLVGIGVVED